MWPEASMNQNTRKKRAEQLKRNRKPLNNRIRHAQIIRFKKKATIGRLENWIGTDWRTVRRWLERQFKPGMTRKNYGLGWNIDHIRPLDSFDLTDPAQAAQAWHFTNLQPMWIEDNRKKRIGHKESIVSF